MKKRLLVATLASMAILAGCGQTTKANSTDSPVIATVGDKSITQEEFYQDLKKTYGATTLRTLIIQNVLEQSVTNLDEIKGKTEEELTKQIQKMGGEEALKAELAKRKLGTLEDYKHQLYVQQLFRAAIESNLDMSEEAIQAYYEKEYKAPMEAQHILVDTEEEAKAAIERINKGETFEDVARQVSKDGTASNGGLLPPFNSGQMVAEFEEGVRALKNGELGQTPVKSQFGYHVIKTIKNGEKAPYAEANKDEIKELYLNSKLVDATTQNTILSDLVKKAKVDIKADDLKDAIKDLLDYKAPQEEASSDALSISESETSTESTEESSSESAE